MRRERPRRSRAAEQCDEVAPFQLIEPHPIPTSQERNGSISDCRGPVSGYNDGLSNRTTGRSGPMKVWVQNLWDDCFWHLASFTAVHKISTRPEILRT